MLWRLSGRTAAERARFLTACLGQKNIREDVNGRRAAMRITIRMAMRITIKMAMNRVIILKTDKIAYQKNLHIFLSGVPSRRITLRGSLRNVSGNFMKILTGKSIMMS